MILLRDYQKDMIASVRLPKARESETDQVVIIYRPDEYRLLYTELRIAIGAMRSAQKGYFDARKKGSPEATSFLTTSKQLEKEVDELLKDELELF